MDDLGPEQADHRFGEHIVVAVADAACREAGTFYTFDRRLFRQGDAVGDRVPRRSLIASVKRYVLGACSYVDAADRRGLPSDRRPSAGSRRSVSARFLLDTNLVSDLIRQPPGRIADRIAAVGEDWVCTTVIVAAELRYGAERKASPRLTAQMEAVLGAIDILAFEPPADAACGMVRMAPPEPLKPLRSQVVAEMDPGRYDATWTPKQPEPLRSPRHTGPAATIRPARRQDVPCRRTAVSARSASTNGDVAALLVGVIAVFWAELPAESRKRLLRELGEE